MWEGGGRSPSLSGDPPLPSRVQICSRDAEKDGEPLRIRAAAISMRDTPRSERERARGGGETFQGCRGCSSWLTPAAVFGEGGGGGGKDTPDFRAGAIHTLRACAPVPREREAAPSSRAAERSGAAEFAGVSPPARQTWLVVGGRQEPREVSRVFICSGKRPLAFFLGSAAGLRNGAVPPTRCQHG